MCPPAKINKKAKHIETVLKPNSYNSAEEAGRTKPSAMLINSGCLLNLFTLILESQHRTALKRSESGNDIRGVFKNVYIVALPLVPLDANNFRSIHD